ncbi:MAG TPA: glycosyltransferase family 2 protein [Sedimenticola sp.]|nr:glycosyltransferase family 2 protein [Sedimenticola sp.]
MALNRSLPVTVVIVNWNGGDLLLEALAALERQTRPPAKVVVMDNGSRDGSAEEVARRFPAVRLRRLGANLGFSAANNLALREEVDGDWVALLNPDAVPEPDWLERMWQGIGDHPGYAAYGCRLRRLDNPSVLDGSGDCYHPCGWAWRRDHGIMEARGHLQPGEIFAPCAAAALYHRRTVLELGGFDESFFCYFEDVDLGFRLRLAGKRCFYLAGAIVNHAGSASTGRRSDFAVYHGYRNLIWCWWKNMPRSLLWRWLPAHVLFSLALLALALGRGQGAVALRAQYHALLGLPRIWRQRRPASPQETAISAMTRSWRTLWRAWRDRRIPPESWRD